MKTNSPRVLLLCLAVLAISETARPAEPPDLPEPAKLERSFVTIPYTELHALWEAGRAAKDAPAKVAVPPPVPYVIDQIECKVELGAASASFTITAGIRMSARRWQARIY